MVDNTGPVYQVSRRATALMLVKNLEFGSVEIFAFMRFFQVILIGFLATACANPSNCIHLTFVFVYFSVFKHTKV